MAFPGSWLGEMRRLHRKTPSTEPKCEGLISFISVAGSSVPHLEYTLVIHVVDKTTVGLWANGSHCLFVGSPVTGLEVGVELPEQVAPPQALLQLLGD